MPRRISRRSSGCERRGDRARGEEPVARVDQFAVRCLEPLTGRHARRRLGDVGDVSGTQRVLQFRPEGDAKRLDARRITVTESIGATGLERIPDSGQRKRKALQHERRKLTGHAGGGSSPNAIHSSHGNSQQPRSSAGSHGAWRSPAPVDPAEREAGA